MAKYKIVFSVEALSDIDKLVQFVVSVYTFEAGWRFRNRFRSQIDSLQNSAGAFAISSRHTYNNVDMA